MAPRKPRKRQHGSGTLVPPKCPGGLWAVRATVNGRRVYKGGLDSKELAERVLAKLQADASAASLGLPVTRSDNRTLAEHAAGFLERRKLTHEAHAEDLGRWRKHMEPFFGHLQPKQVDAGAIHRFVAARRGEGLKPGTVRIMVALLSSLYEELIADGFATVNPAKGLPKRTARLVKPDYDPRTTPFIEKLSDVRRIYADLPEPLSVAYAVGALAGLRTSEVFGLRWLHVDLATRRIHVREQRGKKTLKDKESRIVPVLDALLPILQAWKLKQGGEGDALVIPPMRRDGAHVHRHTPGKHLLRTLERLGLQREGLGWYEATRHTFASQWVMNGGSIEKLKEILGHYSVVVTERYAHLRVDLFTERDMATIPLELGEPGKVAPLKARRVDAT